jgi:hypothetical protein
MTEFMGQIRTLFDTTTHERMPSPMSTAIENTLDVDTMVLSSYGFEKNNTFFLFKVDGTKIIHCMFEKVVVSDRIRVSVYVGDTNIVFDRFIGSIEGKCCVSIHESVDSARDRYRRLIQEGYSPIQ